MLTTYLVGAPYHSEECTHSHIDLHLLFCEALLSGVWTLPSWAFHLAFFNLVWMGACLICLAQMGPCVFCPASLFSHGGCDKMDEPMTTAESSNGQQAHLFTTLMKNSRFQAMICPRCRSLPGFREYNYFDPQVRNQPNRSCAPF